MSWPKMFVTVAFLTEFFQAYTAPIGLFTGMNAFMIFQCIRTMESFFTGAAAVTSLISVDQTMLIVYGARQECLRTIWTFIWLKWMVSIILLIKDNLWRLNLDGDYKCRYTYPFAGVTFANVIIQIGPNSESTRTIDKWAFKWFDTFVKA